MEETSKGIVQDREQVKELVQKQKRMKKSSKKSRINKQSITSFLAGMVAMLIIIIGVTTAVNPGYLTGSIVDNFSIDGRTGTITGYKGYTKDLVIPDTIYGVKVKRIGKDSFAGNHSLASVIIPDGVESIGEGAFWSCNRLTSITIPKGVRSVGKDAFGYCFRLKVIYSPENVFSQVQEAAENPDIVKLY